MTDIELEIAAAQERLDWLWDEYERSEDQSTVYQDIRRAEDDLKRLRSLLNSSSRP